MSASVEAASGKDRGDENFPVGSVLIRPALRPHVHAFYAFARNADDIADSPTLPPDDKLRRLQVMEDVLLGRAAAGAPSAAGLRRSLQVTGVSARHALDLLAAFRQDATQRRYASWAELLGYCRLSAMPVGRHVLDLHGEDPATHVPSDPLCAVLQVLNHLQDGSKDLAALDRCYLPQDLLDAAGARVGDLAGAAETPGLRRVFGQLLDHCDAMIADAAALPPMVRDRRLRIECAVILGLARRLSRRLRGADPVAARVKLLKADVAGSVLGAVRFAGMTVLGADPADLAAVETIVKRAGTSFYRGMKVLPRDRRAAMYAIYAFCRIVDDVADEPAPLPHKLAGLDAWRSRIDRVYAGLADDPVSRVLVLAAQRYALRQQDFRAVIDGMAMDTEQPIIAPDLATLDLYCDRVAAAVGRLSVRAFGDASADADEVAWHLGRALQLTNILRDVAEDAGRGRLYLPREWLDDAGVPHDPAEALRHPALPALCARMAAQARRHFGQAAAAMLRCKPRAMKPARLMGATYAALLDRLQQRGWSHPEVPVSLGTWQKIWIALRHL